MAAHCPNRSDDRSTYKRLSFHSCIKSRLEGHLMRMECSYTYIPLGVASNPWDQDGTTPLMKTTAAEPSGIAGNCAVGPGVLRRHRSRSRYYDIATRAREGHCMRTHMLDSDMTANLFAFGTYGSDMTKSHTPSCAFSIEIANSPAPGGAGAGICARAHVARIARCAR